MTAVTSATAEARWVPRPADPDLDQQVITTIRLLAADAVQQANSGHPGLPMGMAPAAWVLWSRFLRFDPTWPGWPDRDRFVLSAGHGSMLLYALLHLLGYGLTLDDIRRFRQWGSRTPGHPEYGHTPGVETTTGPLGQGFANAVGMALAERMLAAEFNDPTCPVVDHRTYVLASDGDLMEGISHEAASLAGHLRLGRLIVLYDDNRITIDGSTDLSCSDNVVARFGGYGWHTVVVEDGNDLDDLTSALSEAIAEEQRPSLVVVRTTIGYGAPGVEGTAAAHGKPLGDAVLRATKQRFGWPPDATFHIPEEVGRYTRTVADRAAAARLDWQLRFAHWSQRHPDAAAEWSRRLSRELPSGWDDDLPTFDAQGRSATRQASQHTLAALCARIPELVGGSADLAESTGVALDLPAVGPGRYRGRLIHFGVREHAMGAICNGIALHGGLRPFCSTFLVFSDYMRPALRLAALMRLPVIFVFTHDSIGVGEDGPTHQPVEHLPALRAIPGLAVLRPADANETVEAWRAALHRRDGPTALILSRQALPHLPPPPRDVIESRGAWPVRRCADAEAVLLASGSEVALCLEAADQLDTAGIRTQVVSVPWLERLRELSPGQRSELIPEGTVRVAVEAAVPLGWESLVGGDGHTIGLDRFGASAPGAEVMARLGFTPERVAERVSALVRGRRR